MQDAKFTTVEAVQTDEQTLELRAWLRLLLTPGVGSVAARHLLGQFGLPSSIFEQPRSALMQQVTERQATALLGVPEGLDKQLQLCLDWQAADRARRRIVTLGDALYPPSFLILPDPPLVLWLMGQIDTLASSGWPAAISMVGSRNPSKVGEKNAFAFSQHFVQSGLSVVSGLALGIDAAAHCGALAQTDSALVTIAVVGTGLDRVYPKQHLELAHRIVDAGLIVSEFPLGVAPAANNFPKRNRLIAALGLGTLVVEAALQSGSLITARESAELGRDVFAIPGSIHTPQSKGCHALIKQGAKLVESAQDVLEELRISPIGASSSTSAQPPDAPQRKGSSLADRPASQSQQGFAATLAAKPIPAEFREHPLVKALGAEAVSFDALQSLIAMDAASMQVQLLELEMAGVIQRLAGGLYQRVL